MNVIHHVIHLTDAQRDTLPSGYIVVDGVTRCPGDCERPEVMMEVPIPAHLSHTGERRLAIKPIDACIAPLVAELLAAGVETAGSCCGHKTGPGSIGLADGSEIPLFTDGDSVAPEDWRILTEPCDTCGGTGEVRGMYHHPGDLLFRCPNPDCVGGRRVVTFTATRPMWEHDAIGHGDGVVTLGRFTIPALLPVYAWNSQPKITHPCVEVAPEGYCQVWQRNDRWRPDDPSSCEFTHTGFGGTEWTKTSTLAHPPRPGQFIARPERVA